MNQDILKKTVARLTNPPKGILAIDESINTCNKRFQKLNIPTAEEKRREYRELLITAPSIEMYISGYILFDETIRQSTKDGRTFISVLQSKGIDVGIKVDEGLEDFPSSLDEKITQGLEGLPERLKEYKAMGATFAKWRSVINIGDVLPTDACLRENADRMAKYALACQAEDIVPIVEPEVLIDGNHSIERCFEVTSHNLDIVFSELSKQGVFIPGIILKTSMVIPGKDNDVPIDPHKVADMTLKALQRHVPNNIGGIVFLSGGQSDEQAALLLNLMHNMGALTWNLTFSYGRAIQNLALQSWAKKPEDIMGAQALLLKMAKLNSEASMGQL